MTTCKACPAGTNTIYTGSKSINDCQGKLVWGFVDKGVYGIRYNRNELDIMDLESGPNPTQESGAADVSFWKDQRIRLCSFCGISDENF